MIPILQYQKIEQLEGLLQAGRMVFVSYENRSLQFDTELKQWLITTADFFEKFNGPVERTKLKELNADFTTVLRNVDPYSFEKIAHRRREHQLTTGFRICKDAMEIVRDYYAKIQAKLTEAYDLISQIVLVALQSGVVNWADAEQANTTDKIELIWNKISTDAQLFLLQKKALTGISRFDALLTLDKVLSSMR